MGILQSGPWKVGSDYPDGDGDVSSDYGVVWVKLDETDSVAWLFCSSNLWFWPLHQLFVFWIKRGDPILRSGLHFEYNGRLRIFFPSVLSTDMFEPIPFVVAWVMLIVGGLALSVFWVLTGHPWWPLLGWVVGYAVGAYPKVCR